MRTKFAKFALRNVGAAATGLCVLCVLSVAGLSGGCGLQPGTTEMTFTRGSNPPPLKKVSRPGDYSLFPSNSGNPITHYELGAGDQYGFRKAADNSVVGVVIVRGEETEIPLPGVLTTSYYWKLRKDEK